MENITPRVQKLILSALAVAFAVGLIAAADWNRYQGVDQAPGRISVEGTSTLHDWTLETSAIEGFAHIDPSVPADAALAKAQVKPGKVAAQAGVTIPTASLRSVRNGKPFSSQMDRQAHAKLKAQAYPTITFKLSEATLDAIPESNDKPFKFTARGRLTIAGVTRSVTLPLDILLLENGRVKVSGAVALKMTDFQIAPPDLMLVKAGDAVTIRFSWQVKRA
mgnify:FL=1